MILPPPLIQASYQAGNQLLALKAMALRSDEDEEDAERVERREGQSMDFPNCGTVSAPN
jgi:hypothetical protein